MQKETQPHEPDKFVRLRENILEQWHRLPPDDQAAVLVEQLRGVLDSDLGEPIRRELEVAGQGSKPEAATGPEAILKLKDGLLGLWQQLPPEHQATMALVLLIEVIEGEWGPWLNEALELGVASEPNPRYKPFLVTSVCRADLEECFSPDEVAQFDDNDMKRLADTMGDWYLDESYWHDLETIGRLILAEKQDP